MGFKRGVRTNAHPDDSNGCNHCRYSLPRLSEGGRDSYYGTEVSGEHIASNASSFNFRFHQSWSYSASCAGGSEIPVDRHGIRNQRDSNRYLAGSLIPGGPVVVFPLAVGFLRVGAGIGTKVAFVAGWSLLAFGRLPVELGVMGWKFTAIRFVCTFFFAPIAGIIADKLFSWVNLT